MPLPSEKDPAQKYIRSQFDESQTNGLQALQTEFDDTKYNGFGEWFFSHETFTFRVVREAYSSGKNSAYWCAPDGAYISPNFERDLKNEGRTQHYLNFKIERATRSVAFYGNVQSSGSVKHRDDFLMSVSGRLTKRAYRFQAERFPSAPCKLGTNRILDANAANLAEVLHLLQQNHNQFSEFNNLVRKVLPEICQVNSHN